MMKNQNRPRLSKVNTCSLQRMPSFYRKFSITISQTSRVRNGNSGSRTWISPDSWVLFKIWGRLPPSSMAFSFSSGWGWPWCCSGLLPIIGEPMAAYGARMRLSVSWWIKMSWFSGWLTCFFVGPRGFVWYYNEWYSRDTFAGTVLVGSFRMSVSKICSQHGCIADLSRSGKLHILESLYGGHTIAIGHGHTRSSSYCTAWLCWWSNTAMQLTMATVCQIPFGHYQS